MKTKCTYDNTGWNSGNILPDHDGFYFIIYNYNAHDCYRIPLLGISVSKFVDGKWDDDLAYIYYWMPVPDVSSCTLSDLVKYGWVSPINPPNKDGRYMCVYSYNNTVYCFSADFRNNEWLIDEDEEVLFWKEFPSIPPLSKLV